MAIPCCVYQGRALVYGVSLDVPAACVDVRIAGEEKATSLDDEDENENEE